MDAMDSVFTDQSPDDLYLSVVRGDFDVSQVHVVSAVTAEHGDIGVEARVIGASHLITVTTPRGILHEMLACAQPTLESNFSLTRSHIGVLQEGKAQSWCGSFRHDFTSTRIEWDVGEPLELKRIVRDARRASGVSFGISTDFPRGNLPAVPKTVICGFIDPHTSAVSFETAHSYPGVAVIMSKTSVVPLQEGAS